MLFRVVLVTLFFGGALIVNVNALAEGTSSATSATILALIVATYVLTIVYALALRAGRRHTLRLARVQLGIDVIITAILVLVTGGLRSVFVFLFLIIVFNAALVAGRRAAVVCATALVPLLGVLAALDSGLLPLERFPAVFTPPFGTQPLVTSLFQAAVYGAAAFIVAFLSGHLARQLGDVEDELEQRRHDVAELKALNANILASLSSGLVTVDRSGRIIFFNDAAEQITKRACQEVIDRPLLEVFPSIAALLDDREADDEVVAVGDRFEDILEQPGGGPPVHLGFSFSRLRDAEGGAAGWIVIFQDLTEIKELETVARRSEQLAAIGQLSAAIAHEIRNPLAAISGSVEMLQRAGRSGGGAAAAADSVEQRLLAIVVREVDRLDGLITSFLEYSRPRPLALERIDLAEVVEEVVSLFEQRRGEQIEVQVSLEEESSGGVMIAADREALTQVLWNLLNNAAEAQLPCRPAEDWEVEGGAEAEESLARIEVTLGQEGGALVLAIEDDGPGVSPEAAAQIFQPFFTTKVQGTGLGLATSYRLIESHGGEMRLAAPRELSGARFEVRLPRRQSGPAARHGPGEPERP